MTIMTIIYIIQSKPPKLNVYLCIFAKVLNIERHLIDTLKNEDMN